MIGCSAEVQRRVIKLSFNWHNIWFVAVLPCWIRVCVLQPLGWSFKWRIKSTFTLEVRRYSYWPRFGLHRTVVILHVHFYKVSSAFITSLWGRVSVWCLLVIPPPPPKADAGFGWTNQSKKQSPYSHPSRAGVKGWSVIVSLVYQKTWNKKGKIY